MKSPVDRTQEADDRHEVNFHATATTRRLVGESVDREEDSEECGTMLQPEAAKDAGKCGKFCWARISRPVHASQIVGLHIIIDAAEFLVGNLPATHDRRAIRLIF